MSKDWLNAFRSAGVLRPLDEHLARTLGRIGGESNSLALLGAAAASRVHGAGHICLTLDTFKDRCETSPSPVRRYHWPDADAWYTALLHSPLTHGLMRTL